MAGAGAERPVRSHYPVWATAAPIRASSQYVQRGATEYLTGWKSNRWRNSQKRPIANPDLWKILDLEQGKRDITWKWIRAHNGDAMNEYADRIANDEAARVSCNL